MTSYADKSPTFLVSPKANCYTIDIRPCIILQFIKKNPTGCNNVSKFYYSIFIWSLTCFGRHTAYHQEPKTALEASGFSYVEGCWTCRWWTLSGSARGCQCSFRLLMMGGVSPETCWPSYKYGIIKFWYIVASCCIFLHELYNCLQFFPRLVPRILWMTTIYALINHLKSSGYF